MNVPEIDAVVLTHGHMDHTGYLPRLMKMGYKGPIHGTRPTLEIAEIILRDSAKIQEEEAKKANKEGYSKHICPANVSKKANDEMMRTAENIHKIMNCKGVTRVEFRYNPIEDKAYFLEINTHPGLTLLSSAPDIIQQNGISFKNFLQILIDEALQ